MRAPLLGLREKIAAFRGSVEAALFALRSGLQQRSVAASAREVLELLLDTFHVVSKVEKLIKVLPSAPSDWQKEDGVVSLRSSVNVENSTQQDGTTMRETQSMLLERIASEMNRLKFYMAHAQNLPFVENMEKRIQSANVLLDASLGHSFVDGLNNSDTSVLYNCLRAYAAIDNTKSAEEIFRSTIVAPFIHKIVALETSTDAAGSSGDELENDYKQIKHFIAKDCKMLLEISSTDKSGLHVFDFLANSILKEVLSAIQKVKPGAFSPGRPTEFLKNYKASLDFLAYLEDYADFVSLSTKLVDIDEAVVRMRAPLLGLREKIAAFRGSVEAALFALRSGLQQRSVAASAREVLELLLDTFHVVSKVEKLIKVLPSAPSDWQKEDGGVSLRSSVNVENSTQQDGTTMRETQSMLLERIASEMNRLKFYMAHAQNLPFVENMEKRIQSANVLLDASLGHSFVDGLNNSDTSVLYNCLRAYAAIDNTKSAEEIFRSTIVAPFIHKIVALETSMDAAGSSGDELENDYKQIKHFIAKDCKMLLEISSTDKSGLHVFDFLANSILKEVLSAIQKVKPGAFSPGRPTEFLKNYKASLDFLAYLEGYCPSRTAVTKFRTEAVYIEFMKQWNVGVYFSLRFQEIAGALDSALTSPSLVFIQDSDLDKRSSPNLILRQSATLLESLRSCWKEDVLVFSAADKFLRLTLQLLSRYCIWVSSSLHTRRGNASPSPGCDWVVSATTEDFVYVIHDVNDLVSEVCGDYLGHISRHLSSCSTEVLDVVRTSMLQGYCPSRTAVTKFRTEAVYIEFMKQWNVGVYFSLRFQEIAGALDSALTSPSLVFIQDSDLDKRSSPNLMLRQSATLLESLRSCWKEDVLVFSAADKFLRLTLQLLSRYCIWVSSSLHTRRSNASPSPGCDWAVSATTEDFVYVIHDVNDIVSEVCGDYLGHISRHLSSGSTEVLDVVRTSMLQGVLETNRPDAKNALYQATIKQGDFLLNRIQKLSRVIDL
ncbi:hypothetical protein F2Q68_00030109 [Brassica cretica]|uniref:Uncharacterized protein n=1 Tax=Brassica cretica TaxID=69181 RepID=A0A8S9G5V4_BRACR|nr:hypothetical protein F2Q68_00030109 [Brassica cretica]